LTATVCLHARPRNAVPARRTLFRRALGIYRDFFNGHRPHQGIGNRIPEREAAREATQCGGRSEATLAVECEQFLGGLLNSYYRRAA
jgi:hypothetical protein